MSGILALSRTKRKEGRFLSLSPTLPIFLTLAFALACDRPAPVASTLPERLADTTFWRMFTEFSEPGGYFRSDNFVSNEAAFQYVIPGLEPVVPLGSAYLGVGPDQNFTYIVAFRPGIAFITDIRRQNAMQHLMYKALIELSRDRAEFVSRLVSRARPPGLDSTTAVSALLGAYAGIPPDSALFAQTIDTVLTHLRVTRGFGIDTTDAYSIEYVLSAFYMAGIDLTYSSGARRGGSPSVWSGSRGMPSYTWLMAEDDGRGVERSYLATEENFRALKDFQERNLLVPLVGDFAGPKALRAVGRYLRAHSAAVGVFYASNVEQYLFQQGDDWKAFYENVGTLPIDERSTFIRSASTRMAGHTQNPNSRMTQLTHPIQAQLSLYRDKEFRTYREMIAIH